MQINNLDPLPKIERRTWIDRESKYIADRWREKYTMGEREHAGDIGAVPVLELLCQMEQEALDQLAYVRELKRRMIPTTQERDTELKR